MKQVSNKIFHLIVTFLLLVSASRIVNTYDRLTISPDELVHVATGMEWLENGTYYLEPLHPPLARICVALPIYLSGTGLSPEFYNKYAKFANTPNDYALAFNGRNLSGHKIFFDHDIKSYKQNLTLSRLGVLPFFVLGGFILAAFARRLTDDYSAIFAVFFYSSLPIILANSALATTDMPMCALFLCALFTFIKWLENLTLKNTLLFGLSLGMLSITKFSGPIFLLISIASVLIAKDYFTGKSSKGFSLSRVKSISIITLQCFLIIWAAYRFEVSSINYPYFLSPEKVAYITSNLEQIFESNEALNYLFTLKVLPFPEFFHGLSDFTDRNRYEYAGFVLGEILTYSGKWYFFFIATLYKTPLPFLALSLIGSFLLFKKALTINNWQQAAIVTVIITLFIFSTTFNINIGLRHIIPVFPLMAIASGYALTTLYTSKRYVKYLSIFLVLLYLIPTVKAHPFYVSYFNFLAGEAPEEILIDNDFDIGHELEYALSNKKVQPYLSSTKLYYSGLADPSLFGLKNFVLVQHELHKDNFKIHYNHESHLLINISTLKILSSAQKAALDKCTLKQKIGQTFMYYDLSGCSYRS